MKSVGAFSAKTHFSQLLLEVEKGEKFIITKHGQRVAMLVPIEAEIPVNKIAEAIKRIRLLRKGIKLGKGLSVKSMREEGRR